MRLLCALALLAVAYSITGTCKLSSEPNATLKVTGTVVFLQDASGNITRISYAISGLNPGAQHGIHVHEFGLIETTCNNTGAHYNPHSKNHGSLSSWTRHVGDMGNLQADSDGKSLGSVSAWDIGIYGNNSVIGRGLVVVNIELVSILCKTIWDKEAMPLH